MIAQAIPPVKKESGGISRSRRKASGMPWEFLALAAT
jgi:hypothetical protein